MLLGVCYGYPAVLTLGGLGVTPVCQDVVKAESEARPGEDGRLEQPGIGPRVAEFGRGVMMGVYVQELMGLGGGVRVCLSVCLAKLYRRPYLWCRANCWVFLGGGGGEWG